MSQIRLKAKGPEQVEVDDVIEISAVVTNTGENDISNGTLTFDHGTVDSGSGYTQEEATATITTLSKSQPQTVKASYTVKESDMESFRVMAVFKTGELTTSGVTDIITVKPWPRVAKAGYAATKAEGNRVLSTVGKPVTDCVDHTFYAMFDSQVGKVANYLLTVKANGKTYGACNPQETPATTTKLYFTLNDGKQVDFVDGTKKSQDSDGKLDLGSYSGEVVFTVYRTDKQEDHETYPTGLVQLYTTTFQLANGE